MLISVVIPTYNGHATLGELVDLLVEKAGVLFPIEIVVVNDGSLDETENVCLSLHKKYSTKVRLFSLGRNVGEHNAVMAGLNQARGDYAVIMDDDFQNPVDEVLKLIKYALDHTEFDVVYTYYAEKKHSLFRNLGSRFNDKVANIMLQKPKDLYLSSFKIINRFVVDQITRYEFPFTYVDGLILQTTNKIGRIEVLHSERQAGRSTYTPLRLLSLWSNMFTNFSIIPLRFSIIFGFILTVIACVFGIEIVIEKLLNPDVPQGYSSLIVAVLFFSSVQLISVGILGEYIGRIFLSQNKKPQFVIRKRFDRFDDFTHK